MRVCVVCVVNRDPLLQCAVEVGTSKQSPSFTAFGEATAKSYPQMGEMRGNWILKPYLLRVIFESRRIFGWFKDDWPQHTSTVERELKLLGLERMRKPDLGPSKTGYLNVFKKTSCLRRTPQIKLHLLHPEDWDGEFGFRFLADATFLITSLGRHNRAAGRGLQLAVTWGSVIAVRWEHSQQKKR